MNESIYANFTQKSPVESPTAIVVAASIELIIFKIEEVWFGIPLGSVERIVDITNIHNDFSALDSVELLDLHERLFGTTLAAPTAWTIFKNAAGNLAGIPVDSVPTLAVVPLDRIRQLHLDFRTTSPLGFASHVALITESMQELTVFMLVD
jgi:hypothetical protein